MLLENIQNGLTPDNPGSDLEHKFKTMEITRDVAVLAIALNNAMTGGKDDFITRCKKYLETRCADTGSYTDSVSGLTVLRTTSNRTYYNSPELDKLKEKEKAEKALIKEGKSKDGTYDTKTISSWKLKT